MKKIRLTEDDLKRIVSSVLTEAGHSLGSDDFLDIYFRSLRNYVEDKLDINLPKNLPMSYLHNKFGTEFLGSIGYDVSKIRNGGLYTFGRYIYDKNLYEIPDLQPEEKFTEEFAKIISKIIEMLDLPDTVKIVLEEEVPYKVNFLVVIPNYDEFLKTPDVEEHYLRMLYSKFMKLIERYIGVEIGDPKLGQLSSGDLGITIEDLNEWTKYVYNKKIKPFFKNSELGGDIARIKLTINYGLPKLDMSYKRTSRYSSRRDKQQQVMTDFKDTFGYNDDLFRIVF